MSCLMRIRVARETFTASEKKIADYIQEHTQEAAVASTGALAAGSAVSPATAVRFARTLGYESFGEMREDIAQDLAGDQVQTMEVLLNPNDDLAMMSRKAMHNMSTAIRSTLSMLRYKDLEEAITVLQRAEHVHLYGIGASGIAATDFMQKLVRVNRKCIYYADRDLGVVSSTFMSDKDVAVAFSYSGRTKEINFAVENAREKGAQCIAVTKFGKNPLASLAHIVLPLPGIEKDLRIGAMASRYAQLFIVDLLYLGLVRGDIQRTQAYLEETRGLIEVFKESEG